MLFSGFIAALLVAFALSTIFVLAFGSGLTTDRTIWAGFMLFFLIVWLATWGVGSWMAPYGPMAYGVPWLSFLLIGLIVALIAAASLPSRRRH